MSITTRRERRLKVARRVGCKYVLDATRVVVHRTSKHIYVQIVRREINGSSMICAQANSLKLTSGSKIERAAQVGKLLVEQIQGKWAHLPFDRNGFKYHGRVAELAEVIRQSGLIK